MLYGLWFIYDGKQGYKGNQGASKSPLKRPSKSPLKGDLKQSHKENQKPSKTPLKRPSKSPLKGD